MYMVRYSNGGGAAAEQAGAAETPVDPPAEVSQERAPGVTIPDGFDPVTYIGPSVEQLNATDGETPQLDPDLAASLRGETVVMSLPEEEQRPGVDKELDTVQPTPSEEDQAPQE